MKTEKRNVLRACILTMLLAMPVAGSYASTPIWPEGTEISGEFNVPPWSRGITVDKDEEIVRAAGDVKINNNGPSEDWPIIGASGQDHKSFTLDMNGHSLTTGDRGFFINVTKVNYNKVTITGADKIASDTSGTNGIYAGNYAQEGNQIILEANNIELRKNAAGSTAYPICSEGKNAFVSLTAKENVTMTNNSLATIISVGTTGKATVHADNDVVFHQNDDTERPMLHSNGATQLNISANHDILFDHQGKGSVAWGENWGQVNLNANHDIIYNNQQQYSDSVHSFDSGSKGNITAGNDITMNDVSSTKLFDLKNQTTVNVEAKRDIYVKTKDGRAVSLINTDIDTNFAKYKISTANITAGQNMTLDIGVAAPVVHAKGQVNLKAGNDMTLSTTGADDRNLEIANLYADGDKSVITAEATDGTLTISNNGAVGVYANNGGNITLGGKVVMDTADGAVVIDGGLISFTGPSLTLTSSDVGLTADDGTITLDGAADVEAVDGAIAQNGGTIFVKGPLTVRSTDTGLIADRDKSSITVEGEAVLNGADGVIAKNGGTVVFNGPLSLHSTATGLTADEGRITVGGDAVLDTADGVIAEYGGTVVFNGPLTLHSTATGLTADGSNITVGGEAVLDTADGVVAFNEGTILFEGPLTLKSSAVGLTADGSTITVDGDAVLNGADGAVAENEGTILFKGPLTIRSTGTALQAVDGGVIDATADDTAKYIEGNIVADDGTISLDLNKAGSYLTGTTSVSDTALSRAAYRAAGDGSTGTLNLTLGTGTVWNVTGDSSLTNLTNNGTVNMADSSRTGQQLTVKTLSGEGTLVMDLDWLSNQGTKGVTANSDYLTVTDSATGTQTLVSDSAVMNLDKMGSNDRLYVATLNNSDAVLTSSIQQHSVMKGHLYDYTIGLTHETTGNTTDWYFSTIGSVESNVIPAAKVQNRALFDMATNMDTLNKRLGEARYAEGEDSGLWARLAYRHFGRDSYNGHGNRFELGYDTVTPGNDDSTIRQGLSFNYLKSQTSFDTGNGKYKGYTGSFYRTWLGQTGHYLDVVGRIGRLNGEGAARLINGDESKSSFGTWYQQASVEWGRKKALRDSWYIEPQSQLQYTHINGTDYRTSDGIRQNFDSAHSLIGRLGFRLGKDIDDHKSWYFKADILHEFAGNRTFDLTSIDGLERIRYDKTNHDTWYDIGAGLTAKLSHDRSLWFEFERTFNGSYGRDWELNGGMTWRFH